ncbi:MAG: hypothetical protein H0Z35_06895 [Thermoanaerobacteraceae bacterium]|nr:hypothetical protein [Thermoanaerobacteraceae bacterium]
MSKNNGIDPDLMEMFKKYFQADGLKEQLSQFLELNDLTELKDIVKQLEPETLEKIKSSLDKERLQELLSNFDLVKEMVNLEENDALLQFIEHYFKAKKSQ